MILKNRRACVVGSRTLTEQDKERIHVMGDLLFKLGVMGSSGNAEGNDVEWNKYITVQHFLPWNGHNGRYHGDKGSLYLALDFCPAELLEKAAKIAEDHHPSWVYLKRGARLLHTRNVFQALGVLLSPETYADLTIYCAEESPARLVKGGTRTAVEIFRSYKIPTYNLRLDSEFEELKGILKVY